MIEFKDVYKTYPNGFTALKGINLQIEQGEFVAIIGLSGAGKSTILRCINRMHDITKGELTVDGVDVDALKGKTLRRYRRKVGMIFQSFNLVPVLNARENIVLPIQLDGRQVDEDFLDKIVNTLGLEKKLGSLPSQLSGGQQQRVAIARALALHPDILCFDEPTSALDPELTGEVLKVIRGLAEQKTTMIIVTHEMAFARDVADQVIFMDGGFIVEQGDPKQVIDHPQEERTRQFLARVAENN